MFAIINGYAVEYKVGADEAEVRKIGYIDKFGRLMNCVFVYSDTWENCVEYAKNH